MTGEVSCAILIPQTGNAGRKWGETLSLTADLIRGHTDSIILAHLVEKDSYGYEINKAIQAKTSGDYEMKEATLYSAFRRLERAGLITSYWGDATIGARRRYYAITPSGQRYYYQNREEWQHAKRIIDALLP